MGESAGGGSILHHITAYGGTQAAPPFQQAILQSPAYVPRPYASQAENSYAIFLKSAGVSSVEGLRGLSSYVLQMANKASQTSVFYGTFQFGVVPDGNYVPALPEALLNRGRYHQNVKVMTAHNTFEGKRYTDPAATANDSFDAYMLDYFPEADSGVLSTLSTKIYPAVYNGSHPYTDAFGRLMLAISEFTFTCHAYWTTFYLGSQIG